MWLLCVVMILGLLCGCCVLFAKVLGLLCGCYVLSGRVEGLLCDCYVVVSMVFLALLRVVCKGFVC